MERCVRASGRLEAVPIAVPMVVPLLGAALGAAPPEGEGEAEAVVHAQGAVDLG